MVFVAKHDIKNTWYNYVESSKSFMHHFKLILLDCIAIADVAVTKCYQRLEEI